MSFLPPRTACSVGVVLLLLPLGCVGPRVGVVPNEFSSSRSAEAQAADLAHCEVVAREVHREYSPPPADVSFSSASANLGLITRYEAACMRVKGYQIKGSLGGGIRPIDLPESAVAKIREGQ